MRIRRIVSPIGTVEKIRFPNPLSDPMGLFPRHVGQNGNPDIDMIRAEHIIHIE
jgi:hypothetical protein